MTGTELNLTIGRDLAVLGFDGSVGGSILHPALTSVVMPLEDISRRVVSRAVEQIENGPDGDPGVVVPTWVRVGGSTPARDAPQLRAR